MIIDQKPWRKIKTIRRLEWEKRLTALWHQIKASPVMPAADDHIMLLSVAFWLLLTLGCWGLLALVVWAVGIGL